MSVAPAVELDYFVGFDVGKVRDPAAFSVLQRRREVLAAPFNPARPAAAEPRYSYAVRYLERAKLGTPYPDLIDRAVQICMRLSGLSVDYEQRAAAAAAGRVKRPDGSVRTRVAELVVDITGVGRPVHDLLRSREELARARVRVVGVNYTGGAAARATSDDCVWNVPKRDIVAGLVVMLQSGELAIAAGIPDAPVLVGELVNFQEKVSAAGNASYGNDGVQAEHDDYVNATGLAAWRARIRCVGPQSRRLL